MTGSFEDFYRDERARVLAVVFALCGSRPAAEELTQEAFIRAHAKWSDLSNYDRPDQWLRRVAVNLAVSAFRRRMAERRAVDRMTGWRPPVVDELAAPSADVWAAVRNLPRRQREVVVLTYVDDRPAVDVARILGIAEPTVRSLLHRARTRLAAKLGEPEPEEVLP
jgi:RNA polymerase sigma-70 factor (sigma-E family)